MQSVLCAQHCSVYPNTSAYWKYISTFAAYLLQRVALPARQYVIEIVCPWTTCTNAENSIACRWELQCERYIWTVLCGAIYSYACWSGTFSTRLTFYSSRLLSFNAFTVSFEQHLKFMSMAVNTSNVFWLNCNPLSHCCIPDTVLCYMVWSSDP